jgi:hypothetical protein
MSTTRLTLSSHHAASRWASRVVAAVLIVLSLFLSNEFSRGSNMMMVILSLLGLSVSLLLALFVESTLSRWAMSNWYLEFTHETLTVEANQPKQVFDLQQPYELTITKTEGDHKERGGNVLISLLQNQQQTTLLGALGHGELPKECEPLLASAKEATFMALQNASTNALWLAKDGDMARLLPLFAHRAS